MQNFESTDWNEEPHNGPRIVTLDSPKGLVRRVFADGQVFEALARYSHCEGKRELPLGLVLRQEESCRFADGKTGRIDRYFHGYNVFSIPKPGYEESPNPKHSRVIRNPHPYLREIQGGALPRLRAGGHSEIVTGGEPGTSAKRNAEMHARNKSRYYMSFDLKRAFANFKVPFIYCALKPELLEFLDQEFPHLNEDQREHFVQLVILLLSVQNQIPQGSRTGATVLNKSLGKLDEAIMKYLKTTGLTGIVMTRYIDDITVSAVGFEAYQKVHGVMMEILTDLDELGRGSVTPEMIVDKVRANVDRIVDEAVEINDESELTEFRWLMAQAVDMVEIYGQLVGKSPALEALKTEIEYLKTDVKFEEKSLDGLAKISQRIAEIIEEFGLKVNWDKQDLVRPGDAVYNAARGTIEAKTARVTGVDIDANHEMQLSRQRLIRYWRFLVRCARDPYQLPSPYMDPLTGCPDWGRICRDADNIKALLIHVYGEFPHECFRVVFGMAKQTLYKHGGPACDYQKYAA